MGAILREIFDESAYARFLERRQLTTSPSAYAEFLAESRQQRERRSFVLEVNTLDLRGIYPLEPNTCTATFEFLIPALGRVRGAQRVRPIETIDDRREPFFLGQIRHLTDAEHRILQMRGNDTEV